MSEKREQIVRTSKGLQDMLCDQMERVLDGRTTPQSARTMVALSNGVVQLVRLETEHSRFIAEPRASEIGGLKAITFGSV